MNPTEPQKAKNFRTRRATLELNSQEQRLKHPTSAPSTLTKKERRELLASIKDDSLSVNIEHNLFTDVIETCLSDFDNTIIIADNSEEIELPSDIFLPSRTHSRPKVLPDPKNAEYPRVNAQANPASKQKFPKSKAPGGIPLTLDLSEKMLLAEKIYPEYLIPPENFQMVTPFIYRSGFPKKKNFSFLKKQKIKTILTLILEEYPTQNVKFCQENNIQIYQFGVAGNKEPFVDIPEDIIRGALSILLDQRNHPILIHCNKGKHRTGCLVGCARKMQGWSDTSIFDEYRRFAAPKARAMDQQFIELFNIRKAWLGINPDQLPKHFAYPKWCPPYDPGPFSQESHRIV